jgi:hypothetical protein
VSFDKLILAGVLVFASAAHAQEFKCPGFHGKNPLASISVYDGPPSEMADLVPDVSKGSGDHAYASWDIGYLFALNRTPYLVCKFAGLPDSQAVTLKIDKKVQKCILQAHAGGLPAEAECK